MSGSAPEEPNYFAPPEAPIGEEIVELGDSGDAEQIRREHLNRETSIRSLGSLNYLGALFGLAAGIFALGVAFGVFDLRTQADQPDDIQTTRLGVGAFGAFLVALGILSGAVGHGLRGLRNWARWTFVGLVCFSFVISSLTIVVVGSMNPEAGARLTGRSLFRWMIEGYCLWLLTSGKSKVVFSPDYKEVIRLTPHIKAKTSCIVKGFLILLIGVLLLAAIGAIVSLVAPQK